MTDHGPGAPLDPHLDVGAYVIGALEPDDMSRFELHLAGCEECGRQLDELSGLVPLLDELRQSGGVAEPPREWAAAPARTAGGPFAQPSVLPSVPPPAQPLARPLAQPATHRTARRPGRPRRLLLALAACGVLALGGSAVAVLVTQPDAAPPPVAGAQFSANDRSTGASATVGVTGKGWGTQVDLKLSGVNGPLTCSLVAIGRDGSRQTVATWSVPAAGYGTAAQPAPLSVQGAAGLSPSDISGFDVVTSTGKHLLAIPAV
ncbi:zf-HC2 domain-containing protein [Streptomyces sp. H10-C2]|uniref:anti-sigma factor n=1 Tax=unclassified Streptomyces TaxID=2593676 RepID=UPI0024BA57CD|nr:MULTISPECIES: zf-HC2 domain-containing protein [unclassified Streptomyces]MDJ0346396.1 zf-HC2 domain-containing protein [Streptomyces sp. PH10-H1]MDJ0374159.1 zf-HC2 domain-containing protein [Streptomyces sp. H10-C2]